MSDSGYLEKTKKDNQAALVIISYLQYAGGLKYLEVVGAVLYATQTRPDIQHAVGVLAKFGSNPGITHLEALKRRLLSP